MNNSETVNHQQRIRLGMVGGGDGAFIGEVHRMAARLSDRFEFVAGALSSTPERALASARRLGLDADRCYGSFREMAEQEARREDGIEAVAIVTPNYLHFPVARLFLEKSIHVICDKPLTSTLEDALALQKIADAAGALLIVTYNYTGYPMVREARERIARGELGEIRQIVVEYAQQWLSELLEKTGAKQAVWRTDPQQSGLGGATGDIGTHAYNLACFITGLQVAELSAEVTTFVEGRLLDDNASVMLRFKPSPRAKNAKGILWCSQIAIGNENGLRIRIYGSRGGLEWNQENPNVLYFQRQGQPTIQLTRGGFGVGEAATAVTRIPAGHPEGYIEAFAAIYQDAAEAIRHWPEPIAGKRLYAGADDGVKGVAFVNACIHSSEQNGIWVKI